MKPRYLIAKYIPEPIRNEPRNFGVLLWTQWGIVARFLGEKKNETIDSRSIPGWVSSKVSYKEWVYYWRKTITTLSNSEVSQFLRLSVASTGNYILCDGGEVIQTIIESDVEDLLTFLFETLVDTEIDTVAANNSYELKRTCDIIIRKTKVSDNPLFKMDQSIYCPIASDVNELFHFDYYYGNGEPDKLYKRVPLGVRHIDRNVDSAAWQFDKVTSKGIISKDNGVALIKPTEEQMRDEEILKSISVLGTVARVINLTREEISLEREFDSMAIVG
ncbi:MAG TPA: hypothetical protein VL981_00465 [Candidatus Methylacidiphilales bacterium]|nr:hypothetical protein [Candidatus Methylacidiphilales bacterium]